MNAGTVRWVTRALVRATVRRKARTPEGMGDSAERIHARSASGTRSVPDALGPFDQPSAGLDDVVGRTGERPTDPPVTVDRIEVDAGRSVDVVLTQGVALPGTLDAAGTDPDNLAQLAERARSLRRNDDDED